MRARTTILMTRRLRIWISHYEFKSPFLVDRITDTALSIWFRNHNLIVDWDHIR